MSADSFQGSQDKVETPLSPVAQQWLKKYVKDIEFDSNCKISSALIDDSLEIKIEQLFPSPVASLAIQWSRKYLKNIQIDTPETAPQSEDSDFGIIGSKSWRAQTASILQESLLYAGIDAIFHTKLLLSKQIKRHQIDPKLIDYLQIAIDSCEIHRKVLEVYGNAENPGYIAVKLGQDIGAMRDKYTAIDPRLIGFVSMQVYYTNVFLLKDISAVEKNVLTAYFKVIDDYLYMPLRRCYQAAAKHSYDSPSLQAVRQLLGQSTEIAARIFSCVSQLNPDYYSYSGALNSTLVKTASIRDVEMFQVYLWLSVLEENIAVFYQELFPVCVMLYPILGVKWHLVWQMLNCLEQEICLRLEPQQLEMIMPYSRAMYEIFSPAVFEDDFDG